MELKSFYDVEHFAVRKTKRISNTTFTKVCSLIQTYYVSMIKFK